eukprot:m.186937 g.186937  ORF g.186937 m.186937 type:complete len:77 (+) comp32287_c0_seq1:59-289(+)
MVKQGHQSSIRAMRISAREQWSEMERKKKRTKQIVFGGGFGWRLKGEEEKERRKHVYWGLDGDEKEEEEKEAKLQP